MRRYRNPRRAIASPVLGQASRGKLRPQVGSTCPCISRRRLRRRNEFDRWPWVLSFGTTAKRETDATTRAGNSADVRESFNHFRESSYRPPDLLHKLSLTPNRSIRPCTKPKPT